MAPQLGLYESATGALIADWSDRASGVQVRTNSHGFADLSAFIRLSGSQAWTTYDRAGSLHVEMTDNGYTLFEGRLEDIALAPGGVNITAYGYYRALSDRLYTALWSDDSLDRWRPIKETETGAARPDRFTFDKQDRLYITPQKNSVQGNTTTNKAGVLGYIPPDDGTRSLVAISFDWEFYAPTNWIARWASRDAAWAESTASTFANGNAGPSVQTGSVSTTFSAAPYITIAMRYSAADATYASETGTYYLSITNVRVKTTTASTMTADLVIPDLLTLAPALSTSTALIASPGVDLYNEVYEDERPSDILDRFCTLGDSSYNLWEAGVWEGRRLHFRRRASAGMTWYVDVDTYDINRTIDNLYNSVYAKYQQPSGRTLRTAYSTDSASVTQFGLTRHAAVDSDSTSATQAARERDIYLEDHDDAVPGASILVNAIYTASGARAPTYMIRSGDTVTIRNLPPTLSSSVDMVRTFVVDETTWRDDGTVEITPEAAPDKLEQLLQRREERAERWNRVKRQQYKRAGKRRY